MAITQRNKKFDVRVTKIIAGKTIERRKRGISTKGEARLIEDQLNNELFNLKEKGWVKVVTWEDAVLDFLKRKESKVSFATLKNASGVLKLHTNCWRSRPIDSFITTEIEFLIESAYPPESYDSKRKLLGYIRDVFKRQIHHGNLTNNPCSDLSYGKKPEKELIAMNRSEVLTLLTQAKNHNHPWYEIWRVVYELGLRSGEGLALKWSDIDFQTNRISINKSYCSKSKNIGPTKNRKTRTMVLNQELAIFLKELKLNSESEFVLPQLKEWKRGEAAEILRAFQKDLGIRETNFHSLRASFITQLLLNNVAITRVQQMVGHSDLKTTQKYVRLIASDLDGATDSLAIDLSTAQAQVISIIRN